MARKMKLRGCDTVVNIKEFFMVKPIMWEYFITDRKSEDPDIAEAVVCGYEVEMGDVYLPEMKGHIIVRTSDLSEISPAIGWEWVE